MRAFASRGELWSVVRLNPLADKRNLNKAVNYDAFSVKIILSRKNS